MVPITRKTALVVALAAAGCAAASPVARPRPAVLIDVADLTGQSGDYHNASVMTTGVVAAVGDGGWWAELVPLSGKGAGVLVTTRHAGFEFPVDSIGKAATVEGTFYSKIYPRYRMAVWHQLGWHQDETLPELVQVARLRAHSVELGADVRVAAPTSDPLAPFLPQPIDLQHTELEVSGAGAGLKCLPPGADTHSHSTGRAHEFVVVVEGTLAVAVGDVESTVGPRQLIYIPPKTQHAIVNRSNARACYIFTFSMPAAAESE